MGRGFALSGVKHGLDKQPPDNAKAAECQHFFLKKSYFSGN